MRRLSVVFVFSAVACLALSSVTRVNSAWASSYAVLYSFCQQTNCADGYEPNNIIIDKSGTIYGTTHGGGAHSLGTVFSLSENNGSWSLRTLYSFASGGTGGGVIIDSAGNLYGADGSNGRYNGGTIFELSYNSDAKKWSLRNLFQFGRDGGGVCGPYGDLSYAGQKDGQPYDGTSTLYGLAGGLCGSGNANGAVYELLPGAPWKGKSLYAFGTQTGDGFNAGIQHIRIDSAANLYGTTFAGGANGLGTVFQLTPNAKKTKWSETILYNFCGSSKCADGASAERGVFLDKFGNLFGMTDQGGIQTAYCKQQGYPKGCGTVYELAYSGGSWSESVLYAFCLQKKCQDGLNAYPPLKMDSSGNVFGTTDAGGKNNDGVLFELSGTKYQVLYSFCSLTNCADGKSPNGEGGLVMDKAGDMYGTTFVGGASTICPQSAEGCGTIYEWVP